MSTNTEVKTEVDIIQNSIENVKPLADQSTVDVVENEPVDDLVL